MSNLLQSGLSTFSAAGEVNTAVDGICDISHPYPDDLPGNLPDLNISPFNSL